jgi:two-component system sensor histidine kinase YesM
MLTGFKVRLYRFVRETILLKEYSLATKLAIFSAILVVTPVVLMGVISYFRSTSVLEEEVRAYRSQINEQVKMQIEYYLRDIEISGLKILNYPDMKDFLKLYDQGKIDARAKNNIRELLENTAYSRPDISSVAVIMDNGIIIDSLGYQGAYNADKLQQAYWFNLIPNDGTSLLISRFVKIRDKEEPVITIARRIHSSSTLESIGILLIDVNYRRLQEIADKVNSKSGTYFFILDTKGHYVYHADSSKIGQQSEFQNLQQIMESNGNSYVDEKAGEVVFNHSSVLDWRFGSVISWSDVRKGTSNIGLTILMTVFICLLIAYGLGAGFVGTIVRPVRRLQKFMQKVQTGDFSGKVMVESCDEIGQLTKGFNDMTEKLADLIEQVYLANLQEAQMSLQQKQMELKVLQSQINPHFLCNALETIRGMALIEQKENIAVMAASLGSLLRYNLKTVSPTVSLREELNFCKVYLRIQQFRFDKNVEFNFDIPEWAMNAVIVKFSLQPLVENCFIHGVSNSSRLTRISIAAKQEKQDLVIQIIDNGLGIPGDILEKIQCKLNNKDVPTEGENIGIINVHQRIVNLFGPAYGLELYSVCNEGTEVNVRLPLIKIDKEEEE